MDVVLSILGNLYNVDNRVKNMQYSKAVLDSIQVINTALQKLGKQTIFENPDINIEWKDSFVQFTLIFDKEKRKTKNPALEAEPSGLELFFFIYDGIEIHLNIFPEALVWSAGEIENDKMKIENEIIMLLTSIIKVEYHGSKYRGYRKVSFLDNNRHCIDTWEIRLGLFCMKTKRNYKVEEYAPFYDRID